MPALRIKFNYGWNVYDEKTNGSIAVYLKCGEVRFIRWLGFIELERAKTIIGAMPVKIKAETYSNENIAFKYNDVPAGQFVQGCLTDAGVYAVTETKIRLVTGARN